mmetsp:Transcript_41106/g.98427  ORF Transcript_41106/g.98427 Transcript_41106/m.98427 type:complete len:155 (-) Transcript_41106:1832-2296(-)
MIMMTMTMTMTMMTLTGRILIDHDDMLSPNTTTQTHSKPNQKSQQCRPFNHIKEFFVAEVGSWIELSLVIKSFPSITQPQLTNHSSPSVKTSGGILVVFSTSSAVTTDFVFVSVSTAAAAAAAVAVVPVKNPRCSKQTLTSIDGRYAFAILECL